MPLKKLILLLILCPFVAFGQGSVQPTGGVAQLTYQRGGYGADSVFGVPIRDTLNNIFITPQPFRLKGRFTLRPQDNKLYYHDGTKWTAVGSGSGGGSVNSVTASPPMYSSGGTDPNITIDTTVIHTSVYNDLRYIKISDTTAKWLTQLFEGYGVNITGNPKQPVISVDTGEVATPSDIVNMIEWQDTVNYIATKADLDNLPAGGVLSVTGAAPITSTGGSNPVIGIDTSVIHTSGWNDARYAPDGDYIEWADTMVAIGTKADDEILQSKLDDTAAVLRQLVYDNIDTPVKVWRITIDGQSNAMGTGWQDSLANQPTVNIPYDFSAQFQRVYILDSNGTPRKLQLGVNQMNLFLTRFGTEIGIAWRFEKEHHTGILIIDKLYIDSGTMSQFLANSYSSLRKRMHDSSDRWLRARGLHAEDIGYFWIQGEDDYLQSKDWYLTRLNSLYQKRLDSQNIDYSTRFIISKIRVGSPLYGTGVDSAQNEFAATHAYARQINNDAAVTDPDGIHYTAYWNLQLGSNAIAAIFDADSVKIDTIYRHIENQTTRNQLAAYRIWGEGIIEGDSVSNRPATYRLKSGVNNNFTINSDTNGFTIKTTTATAEVVNRAGQVGIRGLPLEGSTAFTVNPFNVSSIPGLFSLGTSSNSFFAGRTSGFNGHTYTATSTSSATGNFIRYIRNRATDYNTHGALNNQNVILQSIYMGSNGTDYDTVGRISYEAYNTVTSSTGGLGIKYYSRAYLTGVETLVWVQAAEHLFLTPTTQTYIGYGLIAPEPLGAHIGLGVGRTAYFADSVFANKTVQANKYYVINPTKASTPLDSAFRLNRTTNEMEYAPLPSAGAVSWGDISGTLADQTDLQTALDDIYGALADTAADIRSTCCGGGGSGTVTDFSFTDNTEFDGTVTSSTTTPTLSLVLNNASVANSKLANSTISGISLGSNLQNLTPGTGLTGSAYNGGTARTFDVTTPLTDADKGDITVATNGTAFTIDNAAVTNAKIANSTIDLTAKVTGTLPVANGGTGVTNTGTITVSGNTSIGSSTNTVAIATAGNTTVTLPTTGTLATLAGSEALTNKNLNSGTNTFPTFNQNTTGSAASLTTTRTIWGQNFNGTANVTGTPVFSAISNTGTLTLPTVTGTLVQYVAGSTASSSTPTPTGDARDNRYNVTALAAAPTFAAPSGTPADGNTLLIRIKDNGTARALAWNAIYRGGTQLALPTTTVINKTMYVQFVYNSADSKWDIIGFTDGL